MKSEKNKFINYIELFDTIVLASSTIIALHCENKIVLYITLVFLAVSFCLEIFMIVYKVMRKLKKKNSEKGVSNDETKLYE